MSANESSDIPNSSFGRRAMRREADIQRYTVDLEKPQRKALAMWAAEWEVDKSNIVRSLLYLLETDSDTRARVQSILFYEADEESDEE